MTTKNLTILLRISAALWLIWGIVHIMAGVFTINFVLGGDIGAGFSGIADAEDPASFQLTYPDAVGAILGQHGFNLLWIGLVTAICSYFIWNKNRNAVFLAAITGGLADLGYFLFLDLGGHVNFLPGTLMTLISASAIIISFYVNWKSNQFRSFSK